LIIVEQVNVYLYIHVHTRRARLGYSSDLPHCAIAIRSTFWLRTMRSRYFWQSITSIIVQRMSIAIH